MPSGPEVSVPHLRVRARFLTSVLEDQWEEIPTAPIERVKVITLDHCGRDARMHGHKSRVEWFALVVFPHLPLVFLQNTISGRLTAL